MLIEAVTSAADAWLNLAATHEAVALPGRIVVQGLLRLQSLFEMDYAVPLLVAAAQIATVLGDIDRQHVKLQVIRRKHAGEDPPDDLLALLGLD